jgi:hypothetical protein
MRRQPERVFLFRLAKELGMTVRRLLNELDSHEISEWLAFFKIEREDAENKPKKETADKLKATLAGFQGRQ